MDQTILSIGMVSRGMEDGFEVIEGVVHTTGGLFVAGDVGFREYECEPAQLVDLRDEFHEYRDITEQEWPGLRISAVYREPSAYDHVFMLQDGRALFFGRYLYAYEDEPEIDYGWRLLTSSEVSEWWEEESKGLEQLM